MARLKPNNVSQGKLKSTGYTGEPTGTIEINENGIHNVKQYASADVQVPEPSGTINITENGTVNVKDYASANVDVVDDKLAIYFKDGLSSFIDDTIVIPRRRAFNAAKITTLALLNCTSFNGGQIFTYADISNLYMPNLRSTTSESFYGCTFRKLAFKTLATISGYTFAMCSSLKYLILEINQVVNLQSVSAFNSTPFRNGKNGIVYVPYSRVASYQSNTNWSALESTTFKSIQENLVEIQELDVYGFELSDYYEIVSEKPASPSTDMVYLIATATPNEYTQHHWNGTSWNDSLQNITLGGNNGS